MSSLIAQFERLIRRDPARRGLIGTEPEHAPLGLGELEAAALHLAGHSRFVGIVTGFFIPRADPPAAETDGPPGAVVLAAALQALGAEVVLLTDDLCASAVLAAAEAAGLSCQTLCVVRDGSDRAAADFLRAHALTLSHLIAIERAGPSHTLASFRAQHRATPPPEEMFGRLVPLDGHGCCHNMRGEIIDAHTQPLHRLFEDLPAHCPQAKSIGIGDGGNEIGMGRFAWEELACRLEGDCAPRIPCRVATDWTIVAGTSNWGAYALAATVLLLRGRTDVMRPWTRDREQRILEALVERGPAVDGVTRRREPTVDGLPFLTYIQPWEGIRRLLELDAPTLERRLNSAHDGAVGGAAESPENLEAAP